MQPQSSDANFSLEISRDFQRTYGAGSVLPQCVRHSIDYQKTHNSTEILDKNKRIAKRLLSMRQSFAEREAAEHLTFPPHLQEVHKDKNFLMFEALTAEAVDKCEELRPRRDEVLSIFRKFKQGLPTRGEVSASGFWRLLPSGDVQDKRDEAARVANEPDRRRPTTHWAPDEDVENVNSQTDDMISRGTWTLVPETDWGETSSAATVFPVHQHDKLRMCCDMRRSSLMMYSFEKMRLLGCRATLEIIARCMSPYWEQPALRQYKSDTKADCEAEKAFRERTKQSIEAQLSEEIQADFQYAATTVLADGSRGSLASPLEGEDFSFTPLAGGNGAWSNRP
eukprot:g4081.t1